MVSNTCQDLISYAQSFSDLSPVLGRSGWERRPGLDFINNVMSKILSQNLPWKFNRNNAPSFLTVALQQDYVSNVTDLGWLEQGWRLDINNSTNAGNRAPKPVFTGETVRDIQQTSMQSGFPFQISWLPNNQATMGVWQANTAYGCGYGQAQVPASPIQQFIDANGNILFINSNALGLSINSPGFSGSAPIVVGVPYGTSGGTQPVLPANSAAGATIADGTITWTVASPNAVCFRLGPLPAFSSLCWLITPIYQMKPRRFTSLQQLLAPIPDEYFYMLQDGFIAMCKMHAGAKDARDDYAKWEESLIVAVRGSDREREEFSFVPSSSLSGGDMYGGGYGIGIGPGWPYGGDCW